MRSLFFRIFFYFLLIILLVPTAAALLTFIHDQEFPPLAHQDFARTAISKYGGDAIRSYEEGGRQELGKFIRDLRDKSGIMIMLFDSDGRPLNGRMMMGMHHLQQMAQQALESGEVVFPMRGSRDGLAAPVRGPSGNVYVVALGIPDKPPQQFFSGLNRGFLGFQLLILLVVSAIVCYLLARSLTSPISRLRRATLKFAGGDLTTRIGDQVKGSNELIGLARDFDVMAGEIEGLISAQKRLLRDISHELRSPLARLGIALELARKQEDPAARERSLGRIELEAARMNEMIGQLLTLTRFETGAGSIQFQTFDLVQLLGELVQDADYEARSRDSRVLLDAVGLLPYRGARDLLKQAFENVIRNAVKYTADAGEVRVDLMRGTQELVIQVIDQGPGVPDDALARLFDPFYRVADARDRETGGTGIGLAIAERSVRLHGGTIVAENRAEGGLKILIRLPLEETREP